MFRWTLMICDVTTVLTHLSSAGRRASLNPLVTERHPVASRCPHSRVLHGFDQRHGSLAFKDAEWIDLGHTASRKICRHECDAREQPCRGHKNREVEGMRLKERRRQQLRNR